MVVAIVPLFCKLQRHRRENTRTQEYPYCSAMPLACGQPMLSCILVTKNLHACHRDDRWCCMSESSYLGVPRDKSGCVHLFSGFPPTLLDNESRVLEITRQGDHQAETVFGEHTINQSACLCAVSLLPYILNASYSPAILRIGETTQYTILPSNHYRFRTRSPSQLW